MSARMRDSQSLEEARVGVRRVARHARLKPFVQVREPIDDPSAQLAIAWPVTVEPELGQRAFGKPDEASSDLCGDNLWQFCHHENPSIQIRALRVKPHPQSSPAGRFGNEDAVGNTVKVDSAAGRKYGQELIFRISVCWPRLSASFRSPQRVRLNALGERA
jgi:hypothetical protein